MNLRRITSKLISAIVRLGKNDLEGAARNLRIAQDGLADLIVRKKGNSHG